MTQPATTYQFNPQQDYLDAFGRYFTITMRGYIKQRANEIQDRLNDNDLDNSYIGQDDTNMETVSLSDYQLRKIAKREIAQEIDNLRWLMSYPDWTAKDMMKYQRLKHAEYRRLNVKLVKDSEFIQWYKESAWCPEDEDFNNLQDSMSYQDALRAYKRDNIGRKPKRRISGVW